MRGIVVMLGLGAALAAAGCAAKVRRTVCTGAALDCECQTSVTSDTHTFDCRVAGHPGWSCCQSPSSTLCTCRAASCSPAQIDVQDCVASSAAAAELVSPSLDAGIGADGS